MAPSCSLNMLRQATLHSEEECDTFCSTQCQCGDDGDRNCGTKWLRSCSRRCLRSC